MTNKTLIKYQSRLQEKGLTPGTIQNYLKIASYYNQPLTTANISQFIQTKVKKLAPNTCQLYLAGLISFAKFQQVYKTIN
jgi:hypothetical protein